MRLDSLEGLVLLDGNGDPFDENRTYFNRYQSSLPHHMDIRRLYVKHNKTVGGFPVDRPAVHVRIHYHHSKNCHNTSFEADFIDAGVYGFDQLIPLDTGITLDFEYCKRGAYADAVIKSGKWTKKEPVEEKPVEKPCGGACGDNRFEVIEAAKKHLIESTNIESSPDEMKVLDSFLFRCWQIGWLRDFDDTMPKYDEMRKTLEAVKNAFETDVIWAPGESPTYEQVEKVRKVYKAVYDVLLRKNKEENS